MEYHSDFPTTFPSFSDTSSKLNFVRAPSLFTTGRQLEQLTREQNLAPFQSLQQYSGIVSPIAAGFPVTNQQLNTRANPITSAMGGALIGSQIPGIGPLIGGGVGLLGGLL